MSIKTVGIIGASGNLGPSILNGLIDAGFKVTALSRESSSATFPDGVAVKKVNFESAESLEKAFSGLDAVVSVAASDAIGAQKVIIDAAVAAGVSRFIPSEFGVNTRDLGGSTLGKILGGKVQIVDYLIEKSKEKSSFTWTGLSTGLFFDWGLERGVLGIDPAKKTASIVDSGKEKWQTSTLKHIGKSVAAVLQHPDKTANKYLRSYSFNVSQDDLVAIVEELTGSKLTVTTKNSSELQKQGEEKLASGDFSAFFPLLEAYNFGDGANQAVASKNEANANVLLGIPEDDVKAEVKAWLSKVGAL